MAARHLRARHDPRACRLSFFYSLSITHFFCFRLIFRDLTSSEDRGNWTANSLLQRSDCSSPADWKFCNWTQSKFNKSSNILIVGKDHIGALLISVPSKWGTTPAKVPRKVQENAAPKLHTVQLQTLQMIVWKMDPILQHQAVRSARNLLRYPSHRRYQHPSLAGKPGINDQRLVLCFKIQHRARDLHMEEDTALIQ